MKPFFSRAFALDVDGRPTLTFERPSPIGFSGQRHPCYRLAADPANPVPAPRVGPQH